MILGDSMGVKLQFSQNYSIDELYDILHDLPFEAGHPMLIQQGKGKIIAWPKIDRCNQIQILGKNGSFSCIHSSQPVGSEPPAKVSPIAYVVSGFSGFCSFFSKNRKRCIALAKKTGEQINALML